MYGFTMTNRREPLDIHHMRLVIKGLAKVHSLSWAYRHHVEENITQKYTCMVPNFGMEDKEMITGLIKGSLTQSAEILEEMLYKGNRLTEAIFRYRDKTVETLMKFFMGDPGATILEDCVRIKIDPKKYGRPDNYEGNFKTS